MEEAKKLHKRFATLVKEIKTLETWDYLGYTGYTNESFTQSTWNLTFTDKINNILSSGDCIVTTPEGYSIICDDISFDICMDNVEERDVFGIVKEGTLDNGNVSVYVDPYLVWHTTLIGNESDIFNFDCETECSGVKLLNINHLNHYSN